MLDSRAYEDHDFIINVISASPCIYESEVEICVKLAFGSGKTVEIFLLKSSGLPVNKQEELMWKYDKSRIPFDHLNVMFAIVFAIFMLTLLVK